MDAVVVGERGDDVAADGGDVVVAGVFDGGVDEDEGLPGGGVLGGAVAAGAGAEIIAGGDFVDGDGDAVGHDLIADGGKPRNPGRGPRRRGAFLARGGGGVSTAVSAADEDQRTGRQDGDPRARGFPAWSGGAGPVAGKHRGLPNTVAARTATGADKESG